VVFFLGCDEFARSVETPSLYPLQRRDLKIRIIRKVSENVTSSRELLWLMKWHKETQGCQEGAKAVSAMLALCLLTLWKTAEIWEHDGQLCDPSLQLCGFGL